MTDDLVFVDELPPLTRGSAKTRARIESLRAAPPGKWAQWPTKAAASTLQKTLGDEFETCMRNGRAFARLKPRAGSPAPAEKMTMAKCRYCKMELGNSTDPDELVELHRRVKAVCDRRYRNDGL